MQICVRIAVADGANVALEMANINRVESNLVSTTKIRALRARLMPMVTYDGDEEPDIGLRQAVTNEIDLSL